MNRRTAPALLTLALSGTLLIAGCSSATPNSSSAGSGAVPAIAANAPGQAGEQKAQAAVPDSLSRSGQSANAQSAGGQSAVGVIGSDTAAVAVADTSKVVRTASMYLKVDSVPASAAAIRGVAAGLGGQVTDEVINATDAAPDPTMNPGAANSGAANSGAANEPALGQSGVGGGDKSTLSTVRPIVRPGNWGQVTIRVAPEKLDAAMDQLGRLGTVVQSTISQQDITANYVDTQSRIDTQKASIERVRGYMAQTTNIQQLTELERQLTTRQADLDALQATLNAMSQKVAMSTITVTVTSNPVTAPAEEPSGFVGGLRRGWSALVASVSTIVVVIGVGLPWLIVVAVLGYPAFRLVRRRRRQATAPTAPTSPTPSAPTPSAD